MEPSSFENMGYINGLDCVFGRYSSFSQRENCPSMTSSFVTVDTSGASFDGDRNDYWGSISPENLTISPGASMASPLTPAHLNEVNAIATWPKQEHNDDWHYRNTDVDSLWLASEEAALTQIAMGFGHLDLPMLPPGYIGPGRPSRPNADPPLSRAAFASCIPHQEEDNAVDGPGAWPQKLEFSHPQTIEPSVTFQNVMSSSPTSEYEPVTPMKHHRYSSSILASSPLTSNPSSALTPQWSMDEEAKFMQLAGASAYYKREDFSHHLGSSQDHHTDEEDSSPLRAHTSRSGLDCEAVIPQNIFACSVPGCVDRDGKPKRFRRQEHKKRHEKTVHNKDTIFPCWVQTGGKPCGKKFTRRDNLNSHLKKTHGSRKNNQRNSYVATLDEKSKYFDEKWKGELTADGLPIGHPRWPNF